jgi:hypothetical protein
MIETGAFSADELGDMLFTTANADGAFDAIFKAIGEETVEVKEAALSWFVSTELNEIWGAKKMKTDVAKSNASTGIRAADHVVKTNRFYGALSGKDLDNNQVKGAANSLDSKEHKYRGGQGPKARARAGNPDKPNDWVQAELAKKKKPMSGGLKEDLKEGARMRALGGALASAFDAGHTGGHDMMGKYNPRKGRALGTLVGAVKQTGVVAGAGALAGGLMGGAAGAAGGAAIGTAVSLGMGAKAAVRRYKDIRRNQKRGDKDADL